MYDHTRVTNPKFLLISDIFAYKIITHEHVIFQRSTAKHDKMFNLLITDICTLLLYYNRTMPENLLSQSS